ncbi:AARA-like protein [Mya arenaria]|uniref:AARA-like protein n=1 Tax=Mya arenaria TaxID=6604 RepID=A0ABY7E9H4_MYAAR|nr:AARA-like protein [Mya arenaria]
MSETSEASERRKSTSLISTIERLETGNADLEFVIASCRELGHVEHQDEWRCILTEKVQPSEILRTMACHEGDPNVVEKCCIVLENLALSDDTCQAVSEAGATSAVMLAMTSYITNPEVQQSCCWALASLSRADCVCMELLNIDAFGMLLKAMTSFPQDLAIQEYGCWALCNLVVIAPELEEDACRSALVLLLDSTQMFMANVELIEHVCYAISTLVAVRECVHVNVVKNDGISKLIDLMKKYDDNVDIQLHSCKVIGNLAVNDNFRRYVEDMGASEAIISCMLGLEKNALIQSTGCMTLTNISAKERGNTINTFILDT